MNRTFNRFNIIIFLILYCFTKNNFCFFQKAKVYKRFNTHKNTNRINYLKSKGRPINTKSFFSYVNDFFLNVSKKVSHNISICIYECREKSIACFCVIIIPVIYINFLGTQGAAVETNRFIAKTTIGVL